MMPDTSLTVDDCPEGYVDLHFHAQYQGYVLNFNTLNAFAKSMDNGMSRRKRRSRCPILALRLMTALKAM